MSAVLGISSTRSAQLRVGKGLAKRTRSFGGTGISSSFTTGMLSCSIIRPYKAEFDSSRPVKREPLMSKNRTSDRPR